MPCDLLHLAFIAPGGPEFLLVMLVLLMMFGAKDAPRILRKINDIINQIRNTADGFKREVMYGDLHVEPPVYKATDGEEELDEDASSDLDLSADEDATRGEDPSTDERSPDIEQTADGNSQTSEDEGDDVRKD